MTGDQIAVVAVLIVSLVLFAWGKWRHDLVAIFALLALVLIGIIPADQAYAGFGHAAVITVAAMLVISAALEEAGVVDFLARRLNTAASGEAMTLILVTLLVTFLSAFMNNVGALVLMLPVTLQLASRKGIPASRLLIPIAFGSILGGLVTLIGTPSNIIISAYREQVVGQPFSLFDFAPVGLAVAAAGVGVIVLAARWLIPARDAAEVKSALRLVDSYLTEIEIPADSAFAGKTIEALEDLGHGNVGVLAIIRQNQQIVGPRASFHLAEGDVLLVEADQNSLQEFINETHLGMAAERHIGSDNLASEDIELVEAVIMPGSRMEGLTPEEMHLHSRYGINVLALARRGATMCARIGQIRLQIGDVLLVQGEAIAMTETLSRLGSLLVSGERIASRQASIWPMAIFAFVLLASGLGFIPIHIALVAGAALIVAAGFLPLRRVYESIDWSVIVLLAAMVPVGISLETTKTTGLLADAILAALQNMSPEVMLGAIIIIAMALSNVINNAATAILMAPLGLQIASGLGYGPDPFLMAIAIGSSCAFVTPIGHQSNLLVMGPGGYRFGDYWRIGGAVSIAAVLVAVPLILLVWPLKPA
jgi:di/tricarboxylate transporter